MMILIGKIIPSDFNFFNYSNIQVETVEKDNQIGVSTAKLKKVLCANKNI